MVYECPLCRKQKLCPGGFICGLPVSAWKITGQWFRATKSCGSCSIPWWWPGYPVFPGLLPAAWQRIPLHFLNIRGKIFSLAWWWEPWLYLRKLEIFLTDSDSHVHTGVVHCIGILLCNLLECLFMALAGYKCERNATVQVIIIMLAGAGSIQRNPLSGGICLRNPVLPASHAHGADTGGIEV